jgi:S-formylglutathione hydrolase FrmB
MKKYVFTLLTLFFLSACGSKDNPEDSPVLPGTIESGAVNSEYLGMGMRYTVWLPAGYDASKSYPFLYLLHGMGDDEQSWNTKGGAGKIADRYIHKGGAPMVIIMPDAKVSWYIGDYLPDKGVFTYESYFHEELMPKVEADYHCNGKRAVAGLSMGGYGTLYYALKYPKKFTYGYSMSPATDLDGFQGIINEQADKNVFPPLTLESGTKDLTISISSVRACADMLASNGLEVTFIERSGGHDWGFWPVCLEKALVKVAETF